MRLVFDVDRQARQIALGPGEMTTRADDARQVFAVIEAAGVDGRACIA
jgi:hypothetical protein